MALKEYDEGLNEAVGTDETTDGPECDAEALIGEDTVVEDKRGNLDTGNSSRVEFLNRECNLCRRGLAGGSHAKRSVELTLAMATGSLRVTTCLALPYLMVPSRTPESSPMAKICQQNH